MNRKLIVVAPAISSRTKHWEHLSELLKKEPELQHAEWFFWKHKAGLFSVHRAESLARDLHAILVQKHNKNRYDEIILVGHSLGGMLIRAAYLMAVDTDYGNSGTSDWGSKVSRIVLLASVNKGVDPAKFPVRFLIVPIVNFLNTFKRLLVTDLWKGSAFITNLRIGWIRFFGSDSVARFPIVIQLLGVYDGLVGREDSIDVVQFRGAFQRDVPGANHKNLYRLDVLKDEESKRQRYDIIRSSLVDAAPVDESEKRSEEKEKDLVVFIVPGIRDAGSAWPNELAASFIAANPSTKIEIANYGYFSAAKFFLPWKRKKNIRIFQDQYSECLAKFPCADFHCVGHSNGTYILGRSFDTLPKMMFNRIYLAGSVLPEDFNWSKCLNNSQVREIRNDRAARDWPVAWLCKAMRAIGMNDVGVGGFDGFQTQVIENHWYDGGHGEAIKPNNHKQIVDYIMTGHPKVKLNGTVSNSFRMISNLSPWFARLFVLVLLAWILLSIYFIWSDPETGGLILAGGMFLLLVIYVGLDIA